MSLPNVPVQIRRIAPDTHGIALEITWSDGTCATIESKALRATCPCATCLEARGDSGHKTPLSPKKSLLRVLPATLEEEINLLEVWPIGNYALGAMWGDKHSSGIFTYEHLRRLSLEAVAHSKE